MLKLFYFFRGYLWIRVSGAGASRFINLCGIRHMMLWDIKRDGESYTMCISLKSFFEMKDIVRKTSTRVVVLKRIGLPFLMSGVKRRWFFPAFLVIVAVLFLLSQLLLWNIHIQGNQSIEKEEIVAFLEEYEVKKGILIRSCHNYKGLCHGYYRIAIKTHEQNKILIEALKEVKKCQK